MDGACRGNPGPGGWGAILRYKTWEKTLKGAEAFTTNNRMELMAAIMALKALKYPCQVRMNTDSLYVKKGISEWLGAWKKRGWCTIDKKPLKNIELWKCLVEETARHEIQWYWVKGHSGHPDNDHADQLANQAIDLLLSQSE